MNRIARIREWGPDLFGRALNRWRVIRTSNAYTFVDPKPVVAVDRFPSKSELPTGTEGQDLNLLATLALVGRNSLHQALERWERTLKGVAPDGATSLAR